MLPDSVYVAAAAAAVVWLLCIAVFRRLRAALPATAFFALLLLTADVAYRVGRSDRGGAPAAAGAQEFTCSMHPQVRQPGPGLCPICHMELVPMSQAGAGSSSGNEISIDPRIVQSMGVRVAEARRGALHATVRAFGELRAAQGRQHDVALKFDGFVEQLWADTEGMAIERGAPLFSLYSPELVVAQAELQAAARGGDAGLVAAARSKLRLWDVDDATIARLEQANEPERALRWPSPASGIVLQKDVVAGAPAEKNRVLLRIADLSVLWLDVAVPEGQLARVRAGQRMSATLPSLPGREVSGTVAFVAPSVDATTRTATVRMDVDNGDLALRPGMFARALVHVPVADDAVLVPAEAILDTGRRQLAWLAVGKGRFEPRDVVLGPSGDDGMVAVLQGLQAGDRVVVSGQFLIDSESRLREGTRKFLDEGLMKGGDVPPRPPAELSAATLDHVDALLLAYIAVSEAMAGDRDDDAAWTQLRAAAVTVAAAPEAGIQVHAAELAGLLQGTVEGLEQRRVRFKLVSQAAEHLFEPARPRAGAERSMLFVHHCPMAEADWLQADAKTRNPYYGSSMLACGAVRRELPLRETTPPLRESGREGGK